MLAFNFFYNIEHLLFEHLEISSVGSFIGACAVLMVISLLYETIRFIREYLDYHIRKTCCDTIPAETSRLWPGSAETMTRKIKIQVHCSQTFLHVLQVVIGYIMMLCVMTYNAWFMICVVLAMGIGHFIWGAVLPKKFDPVDEPCVRLNEERSYSTMATGTSFTTEDKEKTTSQ